MLSVEHILYEIIYEKYSFCQKSENNFIKYRCNSIRKRQELSWVDSTQCVLWHDRLVPKVLNFRKNAQAATVL